MDHQQIPKCFFILSPRKRFRSSSITSNLMLPTFTHIFLWYTSIQDKHRKGYSIKTWAIALFSLNCLSFIDEGFAISKIGLDITSQGSVDLTVLSPARKPLVSMDMDVI
ncbi:hypothetical protein GYH30_039610 [Glycine max]|nr:hypothetical protein GYH30_039610 [Glycine max]